MDQTKLCGTQSLHFQRPAYILSAASVAGKKEAEGPLGKKFDMVDDILNVDHNGKVTIRMSVNPEEIINKVEFGTSRLKGRIEAINKLKEEGEKDD